MDRAGTDTDAPGRDLDPASPLLLGVSSCLLGENVRFDANHKHDSYITGTLGRVFRFVAVCPEMAIGMGAPRPPIRLVGDPAHPRAVGVREPQLEVTDALRDYGRRMGRELPAISGYILKSRSPSCGMERVKIYADSGMPAGKGTGLYAREIMTARPLLPVEEEGRLGDPDLRENFLERVFAYRRWQVLTRARLTPARLVAFHTAHKLVLMAHGQAQYRALGRLVADAGRRPPAGDAYIAAFMEALRHRATRRRQANVLQHLMGYLKRVLDRADKQELLALIDDYRTGRIPLLAPVTLLRHHFRRHPHPYVRDQLYLNPSPQECAVRSFL